MANDVLIMGGGQLGQRYLQGALASNVPLNIIVVDPSSAARGICAEFEAEHNRNNSHQVSIVSEIPEILETICICIVATQSAHRLIAVERVLESAHVRYWILEKLLADNLPDLTRLETLLSADKRIWVNTLRRATPLYLNLKNEIDSSLPIMIKVNGGSWGISSNAIHFVDLLSYLSDDTEGHITTTCESNCEWVPSHRRGIMELFGTVNVNIGSKNSLKMNSSQSDLPLSIEITCGEQVWNIDEETGAAFGPRTIYGKLLFQSEITSQVIERLILEADCKLTNFTLSLKQHASIIQAFAKNWQLSKRITENPPIT